MAQKDVNATNKSPKFIKHHKHAIKGPLLKPLHSATTFDLTSFSLQSPVLRWGAGGRGEALRFAAPPQGVAE